MSLHELYASGHQEGRSFGADKEPVPCNSRVPIRPHVPGTVPVLWVLNSCVLVTRKIRFGMPIVPFSPRLIKV